MRWFQPRQATRWEATTIRSRGREPISVPLEIRRDVFRRRTRCGPSRAELPHVQTLYEKTKDRQDIQGIPFNVDGSIPERRGALPTLAASGPVRGRCVIRSLSLVAVLVVCGSPGHDRRQVTTRLGGGDAVLCSQQVPSHPRFGAGYTMSCCRATPEER